MIIISTILSFTFLIKCKPSISTDNGIEQKSIYLANNIDANTLSLLRNFSYGASGDDNYWIRVSADTNLYVCNYKLKGDTAQLSIWRPDKFIHDYSTTFNFDTSIYSQFTFFKVQDKIVKIKLDSSNGNTLIKDTTVNTGQFFPDKNPFSTFSELTIIINKYGFIGSSYSSNIGDFYIFWISPKFKLLYMPDTLKMNVAFKKYWLDEFNKGKEIKQHWSLIDVFAK